MKKEKWLLNEIDSWQKLALIDTGTADALRNHYAQKKNLNFMIILFSIIGALLIGAGIILIGAKNWVQFPIPLRVGIAFLPLIVSQALAVFTVKVKSGSLAWRESIAVLATASVFTVIAMVGQIFHLPGDYGTYVLTCGLLSLPMIYILNAVSPLIVYYWTILNWAALEPPSANALNLLGLFALGALFVYLRKNEASARPIYMTWVTVIAGFVLALIMGMMLGCSLLLATLCYFILLLSVYGLPEQLLAPFKIIGAAGGLVTTAILTYEAIWSYWDSPIYVDGGIMIGVMLVAALYFATKMFKRDKPKFLFVASLLLMCVLRLLWVVLDLNNSTFEFFFICISNLVMFAIGVGFIVYGVRNAALLQTNVGMATVCSLIVMRFFDSDMDFLWRGIVFLLLGTAFLLVNVKISRTRKHLKQEETI